MRGAALRTILLRGRLSAIIAVLLLFMAACDRSFFLPENLLNIVSYSSINGILAAGMTLLMISREFDISVGSALVLSGVIAAQVANRYGAGAGLALGIASGALLGLVNGLLVAKANINSFIATLGTMVIYQGIAFALTKQKPVACDLESFQVLGGGEFGGLPAPILYFALIALVLWAVLKFTRMGKYAYAIGGNDRACRMLGINVDAFRIAYFVICGLCASFAGVALASKLGAASATFGENVALVVIAAIVLGGVPLSGGAGGMPGVVAAILLLGLIDSMTIYLNIFGYYQKLFFALLLIGVVVWDILHARREEGKLALAELLQLKGQAAARSGKAIA
jgi:ribose/xylose/arabinose/galactoside ABC-type transport system permease subunit